MKNFFILFLCTSTALSALAQNKAQSEIRHIVAADNIFVFTDTSAAVFTLPDATACIGRVYLIRNGSANTALLTIETMFLQTIDGEAAWLLDETNESIRVVSNGVNWMVSAQGQLNEVAVEGIQD